MTRLALALFFAAIPSVQAFPERYGAAVPISDSIVAFALRRRGDPGPGLLEKILDRPGGRFQVNAALALLALALLIWALAPLRSFLRKQRQADNAPATGGPK